MRKKERNKDRQKEVYFAVLRTLQESSKYFKKKVRMICALSNTDLNILTALIRLVFRISYVTKFRPVAP